MSARRAFTLIELLIVVAIIAILAAIAVPNFLEAPVRSKVSRAKADMRSAATALEAYAVDYAVYPSDRGVHALQYVSMLTSPVAYITSVDFQDPFYPLWKSRPQFGDVRGSYLFINYDSLWGQQIHPDWTKNGCVVSTLGPNRMLNYLEHYPYFYNHPNQGFNAPAQLDWDPVNYPAPAYIYMAYDSTNGTRSAGDIGRAIGDLRCPDWMGS